jgi:Na+/H+ antiporter
MDQIETYSIFIGIIILIGVIFRKSPIPISLLLVMMGMLLSFVPNFPHIALNPSLVLDVFLPLLIYQISATSSWRDYKSAIRPIALLSIGHVVIITALIAVVIHTLIPQMSWPMAFLLGAVISPPDDVAIIAIAQKIQMPHRILTILKGEAIFNDATALILFKFSLAAVIINEFSPIQAVSTFFFVVIGEILYGFVLGNLIGKLRLQVKEPRLQMLISLLTPFLAYLPAERLGGCGVLATVVTGLIIEHKYSERFSPDVRLLARSVWGALGFVVENILFLLVGLEMRFILERISSIPIQNLMTYTLVTVIVVIVGRFLCVFPFSYIPRWLFPSIRKREPRPPWQYPFIVSWSGMRGGISLAAAFAIPTLPSTLGWGGNPRDLIVFIVFCVIATTLILQGLTLPWLIKVLGLQGRGEREKYDEHVSELSARVLMVNAVLEWLCKYQKQVKDRPELFEEVEDQIQKYKKTKKRLKTRVKNHSEDSEHDEASEIYESIFLSSQILDIEREALLILWHEEKINHNVKNRLQEKLDHRLKGFVE